MITYTTPTYSDATGNSSIYDCPTACTCDNCTQSCSHRRNTVPLYLTFQTDVYVRHDSMYSIYYNEEQLLLDDLKKSNRYAAQLVLREPPKKIVFKPKYNPKPFYFIKQLRCDRKGIGLRMRVK